MREPCEDCGKQHYWEEGYWACGCVTEEDAHVATLTKALRELVEALPKCGVRGCNRPRTNPAYCDEHRSPGTNDDVHVAALRAAQEALKGDE